MIEVIRLSQKTKDQLVWLKRQTGITQWNVLCRWALCISLSDPNTIDTTEDSPDSNVEMRWDVFAGEYKDIYMALLISSSNTSTQKNTGRIINKLARHHIQRGVSRLAAIGQVTSIAQLHTFALMQPQGQQVSTDTATN